jgi:hypothetical protein
MSLSRSLPAGDVFKARLILMLASGRSYAEIRKRLQTTAPTISHWKKRFVQQRMAGLTASQHAGRKPAVLTPKLQARVLEATQRKPKDGSTHWSVRKLAQELCQCRCKNPHNNGVKFPSPCEVVYTCINSARRRCGMCYGGPTCKRLKD